ncbi:DNA (Cytosine-5)-methyltransferase DRM1/2 isoform 2 [Hibiscus syriacus]|uniref:DNA (Cytosine-5)-methyltransferase DRM1/2 isoform 2 n=1 Tax=Hibiscus syriacus TaxID=106335 RepID=A0A6A2Y0F1_HIBSY|nr:DNA (Cytosine-5)-methyltransferase DRM1/2 isoform 2 [Hibiscus syriacus]
MERCGPDSSIIELTDFICAAEMDKAADTLLSGEDKKSLCNDSNYKKRQNPCYDFWKRKKQMKLEKKLINEDDYAVHLSNPMIGFGVSTEPDQVTQRTFPEDAIGSPYFYYEQIHLSNPMISFGVHTKSDQITQRTLLEVAIGSPYFCYEQIHLSNPMIGSAKLTERNCKALEAYDDGPLSSVQKYVLDECCKWNLVWVGRNKIVPLEPDEVEMLLVMQRLPSIVLAYL